MVSLTFAVNLIKYVL